ncbi:MAG: zinc ribbon domain-containing protein [Nitrosarchaeum sp.]
MIKIPDSILDTIDILLDLQVGDTSRLEHIKKMILENRPLYASDQQYVSNLASTYNVNRQIKEMHYSEQPKLINCRNCSKSIPESAKYCSLCGTNQTRENIQYSQMVKKYNPIQFMHMPKSYQILAIVGGLTAMIPILFIVARMDPLLFAINYDTGLDLSEMAWIFISLGIISSVLSAIAILISFGVKNPKRVGRILFFISFAVLITSIFVGIVGFVFMLIASNVAYKKRHY